MAQRTEPDRELMGVAQRTEPDRAVTGVAQRTEPDREVTGVAQRTEAAEGVPSTAELVKLASAQFSELAREELALARAEMREKGRRTGISGGLYGAAGVVGLFLFQVLLGAAVAGLALRLPLWGAALVVAGVLTVGGGVLLLLGRRQGRRATPLAPERAVDSVRSDIQEIKERARR
ncbi:phage holin family protein [Streptomyces sp. NBC_01304]|uniref:phage holin family protein n=1 Tax=Streptomyces sp. NBC_01304 TaxID=2903818 RepID=UPI002E153443|nr:phage holin family protein [Streptomyces sp. NBC_01304]